MFAFITCYLYLLLDLSGTTRKGIQLNHTRDAQRRYHVCHKGESRSAFIEIDSDFIGFQVIEMIIRCFGKESLAPMSDVIIWCIETLVASKVCK